MTPDELITHYPVLHHMAEAGSWPQIQQLGLRTTAQLVDMCEVDESTRHAILGARRADGFEITHPTVGRLTVRDQKPLKLHNLEGKLTGVSVEEFLELLNTRIFLWTHPERLDRLLSARPYRNSVHDVLVMDTASVVADYSDDIRLTTMNTGATIFPSSPPRGAESFMTIEQFPFEQRRRGRHLRDVVVELCVIDGIDDIEKYVIRVERRRGSEILEVIWEA